MISNEYVQTGLLTGKAWDTVCHWIKSDDELKDSRTYGNYYENSGTKRTAGFNEKWKVKNIYDLAGNVWEWTSEAHSSYFINRGGGYNSDYPVSYRHLR